MLVHGDDFLTTRRRACGCDSFLGRQAWWSFRFSIQNPSQSAMRLATRRRAARARFFHIGREIEP
jgi:hypothetical protein